MVTRENYAEIIDEIGIKHLPAEFTEVHDFMMEATRNLSDWSHYEEDADIREMADLYFIKLDQYYTHRKGNRQGFIKDFYDKLSAQEKIRLKNGTLSDKNRTLADKLSIPVEDLVAYSQQLNSAGKKEKKEPPVKQEHSKKDHSNNENTLSSGRVKQVESLDEEIKFIRRFIGFINKEKPLSSVLSYIKSLQRAIVQRLIRKTSPYAKEIYTIQEDMVAVYNKATQEIVKITLGEKELARLVGIAGGEHVYKSIGFLKRFIAMQGKETAKEKIEAFLKSITKSGINEEDPYFEKVQRMILILKKSKGRVEIAKQELSGLAGLVKACKCTSFGKIYDVNNKPLRRCASKKYSDAGRGACSHHQGLKQEKCVDKKAKGKGLGGIMSAQQMAEMTFEKLHFAEPWKSLLGEPAANFDMMLHGQPGSGKTTLLLLFAHYLASHFGEVLYISSEEYGSATLSEKLQTLPSIPQKLHFGKDLKNVNMSDYSFVILDSVNDLGIDLITYKGLREKFADTAFILILQQTKDGQFRGGKEWEHEVEIAGVVNEGVIDIYKNRYGVKGSWDFFKG